MDDVDHAVVEAVNEIQDVTRRVDKSCVEPRWTRKRYERLMRNGFDIPECSMRFESSSDSEADVEDVEVEVEVNEENNEIVDESKSCIEGREVKSMENAEKRVTFKGAASDVDKITRALEFCSEEEGERSCRSFFYHLVALTVLILALSIAVAVYTVYEFRHLYPNLHDNTAPINITVWRNILNN